MDVTKPVNGTQHQNGTQQRRTSNVRLPLELPSDRAQTSATRVSDNLEKNVENVSKKKCRKNVENVFFRNFRTNNFSFSQFSVVFGGARQFLTSESTSLSNFAPDRPIHSSVRPLERSVGQSESWKGGLNLASASHIGVSFMYGGGDGHLSTNIKW